MFKTNFIKSQFLLLFIVLITAVSGCSSNNNDELGTTTGDSTAVVDSVKSVFINILPSGFVGDRTHESSSSSSSCLWSNNDNDNGVCGGLSKTQRIAMFIISVIA